MAKALMLAELALMKGEIPVGAVLTRNFEVIAVAHNSVLTFSDSTAHAELLCLQEGARLLGRDNLAQCSLYVTLEPCLMCSQAIMFSRLKKLVFGAYNPKGGGIEHGPRVFYQDYSYRRTNIVGGVFEERCSELIRKFFLKIRMNNSNSLIF